MSSCRLGCVMAHRWWGALGFKWGLSLLQLTLSWDLCQIMFWGVPFPRFTVTLCSTIGLRKKKLLATWTGCSHEKMQPESVLSVKTDLVSAIVSVLWLFSGVWDKSAVSFVFPSIDLEVVPLIPVHNTETVCAQLLCSRTSSLHTRCRGWWERSQDAWCRWRSHGTPAGNPGSMLCFLGTSWMLLKRLEDMILIVSPGFSRDQPWWRGFLLVNNLSFEKYF